MSRRVTLARQWAIPRRKIRAYNARRLSRIAATHLALANPALSEGYAQRALDRWRRLAGSEDAQAHTLSLIAQAQDLLGKWESAYENLDEALGLLHDLGHGGRVHELAAILIRAGDLLRRLRHYDNARLHIERALSLLDSGDDTNLTLVATARNGLGIIAKDTGRFTEASACYQSALRLARAQGARLLVADIEHNLGGLAHAQGHYQAGVMHARTAVAEHGHALGSRHPVVAGDLAVVGANLAGTADYVQARSMFRQAESIYSRCYGPDHHEVAFVQRSLTILAALESGASVTD